MSISCCTRVRAFPVTAAEHGSSRLQRAHNSIDRTGRVVRQEETEEEAWERSEREMRTKRRQPANHHTWFHCPRCTHSFLSKDRMMRHYRSHCNLHETRFRCTYCDYGSKYSSNVYKHVRRVHKQLPLFKPHRLLMR